MSPIVFYNVRKIDCVPWYEEHATSPEHAAEQYVTEHEKRDCIVEVREWQSRAFCGRFNVEWRPRAIATPTGVEEEEPNT